MEFAKFVVDNGGQTGLARRLGCNKSYINRAVKRGRVGPALALRIFDSLGQKIGPLEGATPKQIEAIRSVVQRSEAA